MLTPFVSSNNDNNNVETFYDLVFDYDLIYSSFFKEYGVDLDIPISISKFYKLLKGLGPNTSLGRIVEIRSESNKDIIKNFNQEQMKIRYEWETFSKSINENPVADEVDKMYEIMEKMFVSLSK